MLTVDLASKEDCPVLLKMMEAFYAIDAYPFDLTLSANNLEQFLNEPNWGRIWLIKYKKSTIGYVALTYGFSFEFGGRYALIDEFYIQDSFRNKGFGKKTLSYIIEQSEQLGLASLQLEVERTNSIGKSLYEKLGFSETGRFLLVKKMQ